MMRRTAGFTLLEVLIAITITSLILVAIYGIFNSVAQARNKAAARSETDQIARVIFERIGRELRGAWRPQGGTPFFELRIDPDGQPDLRFATASTTLEATGRGGIAAVRYRLRRADGKADGTWTLLRSEEPYHLRDRLDDDKGYPLCSDIRRIGWRFYRNDAWGDGWKGEERGGVPQLVEFTLVLRQGGDEVTLRGLYALPGEE